MATAATRPVMGSNTIEQPLSQVGGAPINGVHEQLQKGAVADLAVCSSPAGTLRKKTKSKGKRRQKSALEQVCAWIVDTQLSISILFISSVCAAHFLIPSLRSQTTKFLHLQYYDSNSGRYGRGWDDMFFVLMWIMYFTGVRVVFMEYLAAPFAKWANIKGRKDHIRFAEQAWVFLYDSSMWSLGFYIIYHSEYWLNLDGMWTNWPDRELDGLFKGYYLAQFAFWLQQILVVNIEERRKDHWQMFTHHIVTCALLFSSYFFHHTKVGNVILCLMDFVDILLPLAKMLRYLGLQFACDCAFGVFILGWIITRHVLYGMVCMNIWLGPAKLINYGCYTGGYGDELSGPFDLPDGLRDLVVPLKDPNGMVCMTQGMINGFLVLLLFLQGILIMWMALILRLAWKVIRGGNADDPRSDEEEEEEDLMDESYEIEKGANGYAALASQPLEEEVGAEQIHFRSQAVARSSSKSRSSGVQLPVKKELLNRVGCDTKTTK